MARSFINIVGSVLIGLLLWELVKMLMWGALIMLVIRALGGDWSMLRQIWEGTGWYGVGAFLLLYLILAIRKVENHVREYEDRLLDRKGDDNNAGS